MTVSTAFEFVASFTPIALQRKVFLAGSAAIAPHTAGDFDFWFFLTKEEEEQVVNELRLFAATPNGRKFNIDFSTVELNPARSVTDVTRHEDSVGSSDPQTVVKWKRLGVTRIANVRQRYTFSDVTTIQLLRVDPDKTPDIHALLDEFDISAHAWATRLDGEHRQNNAATLPSQLPRVLSFDTPIATRKRLVKLLTRYGHTVMGHPDLPRLAMAMNTAGSPTDDLEELPF